MKKYEKTISLKALWLAVIRRFKYMLFIFIPIAVTTLVVTTFILEKTYQSSAMVSKTSVFSASQYGVLESFFKSEEVIDKTIENLNINGIKHSNGNEIRTDEIVGGLSFSALNTNSIYVTISYQSTDKSITQPVLNELTMTAVELLKTNDSTKKDFSSVAVSSAASSAVKNSKENRYLFIGIAAGLVVAYGLSFIDEIISDEVYDKADVELLGCEAFELTSSD